MSAAVRAGSEVDNASGKVGRDWICVMHDARSILSAVGPGA
jgi:hypothetical protein